MTRFHFVKTQLLNKRELRKGDPHSRCAYCFGWVTAEESRRIVVQGKTLRVHVRHPKQDGEIEGN